MIGFSLSDRSDGAGSGVGAFYGIAVAVCPFIGEPVHIIGGYKGIQFNSFIRSSINCRRVSLVAIFIFCISSQVVLYTDRIIYISRVSVGIRDLEMIGFSLSDRSDGAGSGVGAFYGIAVAVCPFIGEPVHIIGGYKGIQFNSFIRSSINCRRVSLVAIFIFCISSQVVLYTDRIRYRSRVSIGIRDLEMIGFSLSDRPDGVGSGVSAFDLIPFAVCPFIGEAFHIISGYKGIQFNSFIRSSINCRPVSLVAIFIFCISSQVVLYTDRIIYRSRVSVGIRDLEMIGFSLSDRPDGAGSCACAFYGIPIAVRPFIGEAFHIGSGYADVQFNSFPQRDINGFPVAVITVFVLNISGQVIFDYNMVLYITVIAVFIIEITSIITAFFRFKCIGRGIRTFDHVIEGIIPLVADF